LGKCRLNITIKY